mgnify:CR=1 FL=1
MVTGTTLTIAASPRLTRRRLSQRLPTFSSIRGGKFGSKNIIEDFEVTFPSNYFRTIPKSKRNIPAAAGSADEATTSTSGCCNGVNGNGPTNGVSGESDEDMEVN